MEQERVRNFSVLEISSLREQDNKLEGVGSSRLESHVCKDEGRGPWLGGGSSCHCLGDRWERLLGSFHPNLPPGILLFHAHISTSLCLPPHSEI